MKEEQVQESGVTEDNAINEESAADQAEAVSITIAKRSMKPYRRLPATAMKSSVCRSLRTIIKVVCCGCRPTMTISAAVH